MITDDLGRSLLQAKRQIQIERGRLEAQLDDPSFSLSAWQHVLNYSMDKSYQALQKRVQQLDKGHRLPSLSLAGEQGQGQPKQRKGRQRSKRTIQRVNLTNVRQDSICFPPESFRSKQAKLYGFKEKSLINENNISLVNNIPKNSTNRVLSQERRHRRIASASHKQVDGEGMRVIKELKLLQEKVQEKTRTQFRLTVKDFRVVQNEQLKGFRHLYNSIWTYISTTLKALEKFLEKHNIRLVHVHSQPLAQLALKRLSHSQELLLSCVVEVDQIIKLNKRLPFIYFGVQGHIRAANVIKANWLSFKLRRQLKQHRALSSHCKVIQKWWRRKLCRIQFLSQLEESNSKQTAVFNKRQQIFFQNYDQIISNSHFEVHIHADNADQLDRLTTPLYQQSANVHLSRIFRVKDPRRRIIYLTAVPLQPQVLKYIYKMLQLSQIEHPEKRIHILELNRQALYPAHFSNYTLLRCFPQVSRRIKALISTSSSYMIAGHPTKSIIRLCNQLDIPVFFGNLQRTYLLTLRSETKKCFREAGIPSTISSIEIYDQGELVNTLSVLICKYPGVREWLLVGEESSDGKLMATLQVWKISSIKSILQEIMQKPHQQETQESQLSHFKSSSNQKHVSRVREILSSKLPHRLRFACPHLFKSYKQFLVGFLRKGGVIESRREGAQTIVCNFTVSPSGRVSMNSVVQKITISFKSVGYVFPQKILDNQYAASTCRVLGQYLFNKQCYGFFSLKLLVYGKGTRKFCEGLSLKSGLHQSQVGYCSFDYLMEGRWEQGCYVVGQNLSKQSQKKETEMFQNRILVEQSPNRKERMYFHLPCLQFPKISAFQVSHFFKQASLHRLTLDLETFSGTAFFLLDGLQSQALGVLALGETKQQIRQQLRKLVEFMKNIQKGSRGTPSHAVNAHDIVTLLRKTF